MSVRSTDSIVTLKRALRDISGVPEEQQRLVFKGKALQDRQLVNEYEFSNESVLHLVRKEAGASSAPSQSTASAAFTSQDSPKSLATSSEAAPSTSAERPKFWSEFQQFLGTKYDAQTAAAVLDQFRLQYEAFINSVDMEAMERLAKASMDQDDLNQ